jgi:hypothetical protein
MNLHLALLLAYSTGLVALGLWIRRSVKSAKDFFVAGCGLGPGLILSTKLADSSSCSPRAGVRPCPQARTPSSHPPHREMHQWLATYSHSREK